MKSNRRGPRETKRAIDAYNSLAGNAKSTFKFKFEAYKDQSVKEVLYQLFDGKCAYCESRYAGTQPMDVEHWRPKSLAIGADGTEIKPGYYWLAADWENLFPACIDCNRSRNQHVPGSEEPVLLGKESQFPVADESRRAVDHERDIDLEQPLLLNPCNGPSPDDHIKFDDEAVVRPIQNSEMGRASINVYALNRLDLVLDRREILALIHKRGRTIELLIQLVDAIDADSPLADIVLELLSHEIAALQAFAEPNKPFSVMAANAIGSIKVGLGLGLSFPNIRTR